MNHASMNHVTVTSPLRGVIPTAIHRVLYQMAGFLWFNRITIQHRDRLTAVRPTLFLGLHRNGVLDAISYLEAVPRAAYLVSVQLHESRLGRAVFPGIAVARDKDRDRGMTADNVAANERCVSHLISGGQLFMMPEGTSGLGPRHLPFKPGAAHIAAAVLRSGVPLTVIPLAIHYERAWEWQSRVEVVAGEPVTYRPGELSASADSFSRFAQDIAVSLERTGINVESEDELRLIEMLAYLANRQTGLSYSWCLKCLESGVPRAVRESAETLTVLARKTGAWTYQGVSLVHTGPKDFAIAMWSVIAPVIAVFLATNLPPLAAGRLAGRVLPDNRNVVGFWSAAVGIPAALIWSAVVVISLIATGHNWLAAAYAFVSVIGVRLFHEFRERTVALYNTLRAPELRAPYLELGRRLCKYLHDRL